MRKIGIISLSLIVLSACSKPDPILPGTRTSIFEGSDIIILNKNIPNLPENIDNIKTKKCPYTQDNSNVIWRGDKKIFSGFPSNNFVETNKTPVCDDGFVYVGLTTGELVKINPNTRDIAWIADIFKNSNMTGGSAILDITAPVKIQNGYVYAGGLGDAFCKISAATGNKKWCADIGISTSFIIIGDFAFITGTDNGLYAIKTSNGSIYWRAELKKTMAPVYKDKIITVGDEEFDALTGKKID